MSYDSSLDDNVLYSSVVPNESDLYPISAVTSASTDNIPIKYTPSPDTVSVNNVGSVSYSQNYLAASNRGARLVHVSTPSLQKVSLFGKENAAKLVNAQGTLCKRCQDKRQTGN